MDVLIIGGGLTGLTTALVLAERGHRVEIFEAKASTCRAANCLRHSPARRHPPLKQCTK